MLWMHARAGYATLDDSSPDVWPERKIACNVDGVLWPDAFWRKVLRINRFVSPLHLCSYLQKANGNARDILTVFLYLAHIIRKVKLLEFFKPFF